MGFVLAAASPLALAQAKSAPAPPPSQSAVPAAPATAPAPLLPADFAGWTKSGPTETGATPEAADRVNADVLKEYGLKDFAVANYIRGGDHGGSHGGGKATVRAMRFADATGAYGAFTFYRKPEMRTEDIGKGAGLNASTNEVLFWNGQTLFDATFDHAGSAEINALKQMAAAMPQMGGPEGLAPSLQNYLPRELLDANSVRYAIGPLAYARGGGALPPELIEFSLDAEAVTGQYKARDGKGTLTVLEYPTPQMAKARAKAIDDLLKTGSLPGSNAVALSVHRSGPLVVVTSGNFSSKEAQDVLARVKYEAAITWNHPEGYVSEVGKTARLLLGILYLTGILGVGALLLGLFLGGGRALVRVMRGKSASTLNEEQFITLKLRD
jgi:Family of unknown function (DUF6599)